MFVSGNFVFSFSSHVFNVWGCPDILLQFLPIRCQEMARAAQRSKLSSHPVMAAFFCSCSWTLQWLSPLFSFLLSPPLLSSPFSCLLFTPPLLPSLFYLKGRATESNQSPISWFTPHMDGTPRSESHESQQPRTLSWFPMWVQGPNP